jgi:hypothetical protein
MQEMVKRPKEVVLAFWAIVIAQAVAVAEVMLEKFGIGVSMTQQMQGLSESTYIITVAVSIALILVLAVLVYFKQNWARVVFIVIVVISLASSIPVDIKEFGVDKIGFTSSVLQFLFLLASIFLLLTRNSSEWYKKKKEEEPEKIYNK